MGQENRNETYKALPALTREEAKALKGKAIDGGYVDTKNVDGREGYVALPEEAADAASKNSKKSWRISTAIDPGESGARKNTLERGAPIVLPPDEEAVKRLSQNVLNEQSRKTERKNSKLKLSNREQQAPPLPPPY